MLPSDRLAELVLTTPERLADPEFLELVARNTVDFISFDAARADQNSAATPATRAQRRVSRR